MTSTVEYNCQKTEQLAEKTWDKVELFWLWVQNGGTFYLFHEEEKGNLLVKNIARTATRHLVGQHVLLGGYLQYWTTLYLLNLPINRQLKVTLTLYLEVTGARKNRACERDTRGERERLPKRPIKIIFLAFCECWKFLLVRRLLREFTVFPRIIAGAIIPFFASKGGD